jgi:hypothetical protein
MGTSAATITASCNSRFSMAIALVIDLRSRSAYQPPLRRSSKRALHRHDPYIRTRAARPPVDVIVHGGEMRLGPLVTDGEAEGECSTR